MIKVFGEHHRDAFEQDLTGDGGQELVATTFTSVNIFGCIDGQYQALLWQGGIYSSGISITIQDMNLDNAPEIVVHEPDSCGFSGRCSETYIYEWDGVTTQ